jgi:hypothetical protein
MSSVFGFANKQQVDDKEENETYHEDHPVIVNIVDAFYSGATVTIIGTALYTLNMKTHGAVMSAINMVAGVANNYFETTAKAVPIVIRAVSVSANDIVMESISDCMSQLYQTGAAFVTIFSGILNYGLNYGPEIAGSVIATKAVTTLNKFKELQRDEKKKCLRQYLAIILNGILNAHKDVQNIANDVGNGIMCANKLNDIQTLKNEVADLSRDELAQMVEFVIPYMRSAEYNLSPEDLSFMAGVGNISSVVNSDSIDKINLIITKKMCDYNSNDIRFKLLQDLSDTMYRTPEVTQSQDNYENICKRSVYENELKRAITDDSIFKYKNGGKKSKRTKKRKPVIRRKQTKRVQRKQTKRLQKKLRKKQTKK